ncbi:hypothetical protein [Aliivibrio sp. S10_S31]|uniref:hypothetical protein n=1 Tax=Aliivibrio sp. S10_S31 TaxID=2720224 RepID=UPI00168182E1|nr:hypothetical protein [Aliivibrio sp. S10_S31]MBD1569718.1 hypothetical protein [Aliivibrio sp. S10_S31]
MNVNPAASSVSAEATEVPLDTLMLTVMSERADQCEETVRIIANEIDAQNQQLDVYNETKEAVMGAEQEEYFTLSEEEFNALQTAVGEENSDTYTAYPNSDGTYNVKINGKKEDFDENKSVINTALDNEISSLNSLSQMKMIDLQSAMDKYNNAYSSASNFASKYNSSLSNVVSNMR